MKTALVSFKTKNQETAEKLRNSLIQLKKKSKSEEGLQAYEIFQAEEDSLSFYVRESWKDQQAFDQHLKQPHLQEFFKELPEWLQEPFTATPIVPIEEDSV